MACKPPLEKLNLLLQTDGYNILLLLDHLGTCTPALQPVTALLFAQRWQHPDG